MGKLTIENENLAAWMTMTNTFARKLSALRDTSSWDKGKYYWNGVMIQLGRYKPFNPKGKLKDRLGSVEISDGKRTENLSREAFTDHTTWINLTPAKRGAGRDEPMSPADLARLFSVRKGGAKKRSPDLRSLHNYLEPYAGGITIWPDAKLTVTVEPAGTGVKKVHRRHAFEWSGALRAEVFQDGKLLYEFPEVRTVTVSEEISLPGGIHQDPPQR